MGMAMIGRCSAVTLLAFGLSACQADGPFAAATRPGEGASTTRLLERDVEAPDVFQRSAPGVWPGTPSFGGVWVAHPDSAGPERALIRNADTGQFVIGSLFRRDGVAETDGFDISSDAAAALGVPAGIPVALNVTALRRQQVRNAPSDPAATQAQTPETATQTVRVPPTGTGTGTDAATQAEPAATRPAAAIPVAASPLAKPYVQLGIFSVEANATTTANRLRDAGVVPVVLRQQSAGKTFWRVLAGPARSPGTRAALLAKARALGFADAYPVSD